MEVTAKKQKMVLGRSPGRCRGKQQCNLCDTYRRERGKNPSIFMQMSHS